MSSHLRDGPYAKSSSSSTRSLCNGFNGHLRFIIILQSTANELCMREATQYAPPLYAARCSPAPAHTRLTPAAPSIIIIIETFVARLLQLKNEHKRYICYIKIYKKIKDKNDCG